VFGAAHWLYVDPEARGRGVARALVRYAVAELAALGITHVELASLTGDDQWLARGWLPYLVHYVLPLSAVAVGAAEHRPAPEAAPALEAPARGERQRAPPAAPEAHAQKAAPCRRGGICAN
jgi:GNAT superfamily N-acetyltransferase